MADIFISYKREDHQFAEDVKSRVEAWGYTTWWDKDIKSGENYVTRIRTELDAAKAIIVLLTSKAVKQDSDAEQDSFVLAEVSSAKRKKALIPVVVPPLQAADLPPPFNHMQTLRWADSENIHVELHRHAIEPQNAPIEAPSFRQDVFTTSIPTYTEVDRTRTREFQDLKAHLRMRGRIVRLYGATQTGKTVLARRAQAGLLPIELKGGQITTRASFFDAIAALYAPELPVDAREFRVIRFLSDSGRPVIIDDFHRIPAEVQAAIIEVAKGLIENGVTFVLVSIPDCARDLIGEFMNRTIAIKAPRWTRPQLQQIPILGFRRMKMLIYPQVIDELIHQSHGNPLLVQDYCYRICESARVLESFREPTPVPIARSALVEIFRAVAATRAYDLLPIVHPDGDAEPRVRWGTGGRRVSLQALILIVLDRRGGFQELLPETIANHANKIVAHADRRHVTGPNVLKAGEILIERLSEAGYADTVIAMKNGKFFIQLPDFKVHLHWTLAPLLTGNHPQLERFTTEHAADDIAKAYSGG